MPTFSDYDFYRSHGGKLPEKAYLAAVDDAHAEILSQTNGKAQTAPTEMEDAIKLCECALVDVISSYREGAAQLPKGIGSITNDKLTVTAGNIGMTTAQTEALDRRAICTRYLQWPVNLMCGWL